MKTFLIFSLSLFSSISFASNESVVCGKFIVEKDSAGFIEAYYINDGSDGNLNANHSLIVDDSNISEGPVAAIRSLQNSLLSLMIPGQTYCVTGKVSRGSVDSDPAAIIDWTSVQAR